MSILCNIDSFAILLILLVLACTVYSRCINNIGSLINPFCCRLGDDGGQAICRALLKNSTLTHVHLGSNDLGEPTAAILSQVLMFAKGVAHSFSCSLV